jgi:anthranilate phosphoribosyltransferase
VVTTVEDLGGWASVLGPLTQGRDLPAEHARAAMRDILEGSATSAQIAGFIVGLRMKGETVDELAGLLDAMADAAERVTLASVDGVVDIVGTGGDRSHSVNVSTMASIVVAGAGVPVCKHGNRAASSRCGSADLLESLGVNLELGPAGVARCVEEAGLGFCFAPRFHPAMRHAVPTRRELGVPTVFNLLGPLANPAGVRRQVVGVADAGMAERMARVLASRGAERVLVVHGDDGLDELTTTTTSSIVEVIGDEVRRTTVDPTALGLSLVAPEALVGGDAAANAAVARSVLAGDDGPVHDIVVLNAAAGLVASGRCDDLESGIAVARTAIANGSAQLALDRLVELSNAPSSA